MANKANVTHYTREDELAEEMVQLVQWLEPTDGLRPPWDVSAPIHLGQALGAGHSEMLGKVTLEPEQMMGEITLEQDGKEPGAEQESRPGTAYGSKGVSPSGKQAAHPGNSYPRRCTRIERGLALYTLLSPCNQSNRGRDQGKGLSSSK